MSAKRELKFEDFPLVDESQIPMRATRSIWLDFFRRIGRGKALAIPAETVPPSSLREAVKRLKESKQLPANFIFTARKQPDGKVVSYIINSSRVEGAKATGKRGLSKDFNIDDIVTFILSRPNYEHSLPLVQEHFLGKILSSREDESDYHRTYNVVRRAREAIEERFGGRFKEELESGRIKVYRFQKNQS